MGKTDFPILTGMSDSTHSYFSIIAAFRSTSGDMAGLADMINAVKAGACADTSLLGTFTENHDQPRFGALTPDMALAKNVIVATMLSDGIPVIYNGQEQHYQAYGGQSTPYNREAIWLSGYNEDAELFVATQRLNAARKNAISDDSTYLTYQAYPIYQDGSTVATRKGKMVTVLTNAGADGSAYTLDLDSGYDAGTQVTELLSCTTITTSDGGTLAVPMDAGQPKVFYPTTDAGSVCSSASRKVQKWSA